MKLTKLFATTDWTEATLAEACGVNNATINRLRTSDRTASLDLSLKIERVTKGEVGAHDLPLSLVNRRLLRMLKSHRWRQVGA